MKYINITHNVYKSDFFNFILIKYFLQKNNA